jgi:transposase-like protein
MSQRSKFDKAFKWMSVELCLSGKSTTEVATELGLRHELVSHPK